MKKRTPLTDARRPRGDDPDRRDAERLRDAAEQLRAQNERRRENAERTRAAAERDRAASEVDRRAALQAVTIITSQLKQTTAQMKALEEMRRNLHQLLTGTKTGSL